MARTKMKARYIAPIAGVLLSGCATVQVQQPSNLTQVLSQVMTPQNFTEIFDGRFKEYKSMGNKIDSFPSACGSENVTVDIYLFDKKPYARTPSELGKEDMIMMYVWRNLEGKDPRVAIIYNRDIPKFSKSQGDYVLDSWITRCTLNSGRRISLNEKKSQKVFSQVIEGLVR